MCFFFLSVTIFVDMFGMCIDESGQEQTLPCAEATLRPCPVTAVCVLSGHPVLEWSHQLLVKTCQTLANTVEYFTRPLSIQALLHGMPSNLFNILLLYIKRSLLVRQLCIRTLASRHTQHLHSMGLHVWSSISVGYNCFNSC